MVRDGRMETMRKPVRQRRGSGAKGILESVSGAAITSSAAGAAGLFLLVRDARDTTRL